MLKLVHEKYAKDVDERREYVKEFAEALVANENLRPLISKVPVPAVIHSSGTLATSHTIANQVLHMNAL